MRRSNVPFWCNYRCATDWVCSYFQNANPWDFTSSRFIPADNSYNVWCWLMNDITTWPWKVPWISAATSNTAVITPSSFLGRLVTRSVVTFTCSVTIKIKRVKMTLEGRFNAYMNPSPQVTLHSDQLLHSPYAWHELSPHASTSSTPATVRTRLPPPPHETVHGVHSPKREI